MNNQLLNKLSRNQIRPSVIERFTDAAEIEALGLDILADEEVKEIAFFGTPLESCKSYDDRKFLIQVYIRTEHYEFTGFPDGNAKFIYPWSHRYEYSYYLDGGSLGGDGIQGIQGLAKNSRIKVINLARYEGLLSEHPEVADLQPLDICALINIKKGKVTIDLESESLLINDDGNLMVIYMGNYKFKIFNLMLL